MNLSRKPPLNLKLNRQAPSSIPKAGPIKLNEAASAHETPETKMADRLVIACRENVRFLNFHLHAFEKYLELPALVDNALYLAYTIRVKDNDLFDALSLRKALTKAGVETSSAFSFIASDYDDPKITASDEYGSRNSISCLDTQAFCLACHQYLTILDLKHIVDTFEEFFHRSDPEPAGLSSDKNPGGSR